MAKAPESSDPGLPPLGPVRLLSCKKVSSSEIPLPPSQNFSLAGVFVAAQVCHHASVTLGTYAEAQASAHRLHLFGQSLALTTLLAPLPSKPT